MYIFLTMKGDETMEQEWMNAMEDSLLPEGWQEGEDLFAQSAGEGGLTTEASEGGIPAAGYAVKTEAPRTYRLKVNHEEKEVTLSEDEVVARLQKSYAFDAMKERRDRDYAAEVRQLQRLYPEFREMPDEVAHLAAEGESLLTAYAVWQGREAQKIAESLREENRVLRQNASAAAKAPVKGVSGGGAARGRSSDFERGFESVEW